MSDENKPPVPPAVAPPAPDVAITLDVYTKMIDKYLREIYGRSAPGFKCSQEFGELMGALALAQGEMTNPVKSCRAVIKMREEKGGGSYEFMYADLAAVVDSARPALAKNGLAFVQPIIRRGNELTLITMLGHKSGQWVQTELPLGSDAMPPRDLGIKITYCRRFALSAILGIASEDDRDAQDDESFHNEGRRQQPPARSRKADEEKPRQDPGPDAIVAPYKYKYADEVITQIHPKVIAKRIGELTVEELGQTRDRIEKRIEHFQKTKPPQVNIVADGKRDLELINKALDSLKTTPQASPSPNTAPKADAPPRSSTPADQATQAPTTGKPAADLPAGVSGEVASLAHPDEGISVAQALVADELVLLRGLLPSELLAMVQEKANVELFPTDEPAIAPSEKFEAGSSEWLEKIWLAYHEAHKQTRLKARKLLRVAIIVHRLAERAGVVAAATPKQEDPKVNDAKAAVEDALKKKKKEGLDFKPAK